jgi:hypothetical protein
MQQDRPDRLRGGFKRRMVDRCERKALGCHGGEGYGRGRRQHQGAWRGSHRFCKEAHRRWMSHPSEQKIASAECFVPNADMGREFAQPILTHPSPCKAGPGWFQTWTQIQSIIKFITQSLSPFGMNITHPQEYCCLYLLPSFLKM